MRKARWNPSGLKNRMVEYTIQKQKAAHVHKEKKEHGLKKTIPGTSLGSEGGFELR